MRTDLWTEGLRYAAEGRRGPGVRILDGVDLTVRAGRVRGVLGPNGSGKTTLLRLLIGALRASGGESFVGEARVGSGGGGGGGNGSRSLSSMPRLERARLLAMVEQDAQAHTDLTVAEVIALGRLPHQGRFQVADPSADLPHEVARRAGVDHLLQRSFHTLSGGERQRVHLARALAQTPQVLLLDEPTNHLDIAAQLQLLDLVRGVAAEGAGVLITLHDLSLAARVCDEVTVLQRGQVVAAGRPLEVLTPALIGEVWGVRAHWVTDGGQHALIFS